MQQITVMDFPTGVDGSTRLNTILRNELSQGAQRVVHISSSELIREQRKTRMPKLLVDNTVFASVSKLPQMFETDLIILEGLHRDTLALITPRLRSINAKGIALNCHVKGFTQ